MGRGLDVTSGGRSRRGCRRTLPGVGTRRHPPDRDSVATGRARAREGDRAEIRGRPEAAGSSRAAARPEHRRTERVGSGRRMAGTADTGRCPLGTDSCPGQGRQRALLPQRRLAQGEEAGPLPPRLIRTSRSAVDNRAPHEPRRSARRDRRNHAVRNRNRTHLGHNRSSRPHQTPTGLTKEPGPSRLARRPRRNRHRTGPRRG